MSVAGKREKTLSLSCPSTMLKHRCVTIDHAAGSVAYTAAGEIPDAVTLCDAVVRNIGSTNYTVEVQLLQTLSGTEFFTAGAVITRGVELEVVGAVGKVQPVALGEPIGVIAASPASGDGYATPCYSSFQAEFKTNKAIAMKCATALLAHRCVTITAATITVAYTAAGDVPSAITLGDAYLVGVQYYVDIQLVSTLDGTELVTAAAVISVGAELEVVGAVGKVQTKNTGDAIGLLAYEAAAADGDNILTYKG